MKLAPADLRQLADVAVAAATEAGHLVASSRPHQVERKVAGASLASQVVTEIDRRSEEIILHHLAPTLERFELALLTEERHDDGGRLVADHYWCIDPLDGTLPFVEGRHGYAVSIAVVGRDGTPWIGVVFDPVDGVLMHAVRRAGAFRDRQRWTVAAPSRSSSLTVFADRSFLASPKHDELVEELERAARDVGLVAVEVRVGAGAVMNACGVLARPPACYFKSPGPTGGGSLWDFAATACLFHEVGGVATDIHGARLDLNRPDDTFMNHRGTLFATDERIADLVRTAIRRTG